MDILDAPQYWADAFPDSVAVRDEHGDLTWSELDARIRRGSSRLVDAGVHAGDRVGLLMANTRGFVVSDLAILGAGAILVPINFRLHPREIAEQLADAQAVALLHDDVHQAKAVDATGDSSVPAVLIDYAPTVSKGGGVRVLRDEGEIAVVLYSSGTTGRPKGIAVTHRSIYAMAHDRIINGAWGSHTRTYVPYPLAFSAGLLASWMATMVAGGITVLDATFDPSRALRRFEEDGITVLMSVPTLWQAIADHPDLSTTVVSSLSTVSAGGAMVSTDLMAKLRDRGILLSQGYGLTESSGVATALRPQDVESRPGSIGKPMMRMQAKIVRPDGSECLPGERGELWLRGPAVMAGYWSEGRLDPLSLHDGWLATGDVATADADGFLYLVDRLKDMIITGGINVFPAEIERVLGQIPGVLECAVVGAAHPKWGEPPVAFVVTGDDALTVEYLEAEMRMSLASHKIPSQIHLRSSPLPRSANGKVLRRELREDVNAHLSGKGETVALINRYFNAVNSRDWETLRAVLHPEATIRHGDLLSAEGADSVVTLYQAILQQYREGQHEDRPTRILVQGDLVAVEIFASVVKLTGERIEFPAADVIEIEDGRIRRISTWYDTAVVVPLIKGDRS